MHAGQLMHRLLKSADQSRSNPNKIAVSSPVGPLALGYGTYLREVNPNGVAASSPGFPNPG